MQLTTSDVIIAAIIVLWIGHSISMRSAVLQKYQIPLAVVGGLFVSMLLNIMTYFTGIEIIFDFSSREMLLLVFFSSVGLAAELSALKQGGVLLFKLALATAVFLFLQNLVGIIIASILGEGKWFGLIGGSISLAGGHGTAISWGSFFNEQGKEGAVSLGIAFATIGLIAGGLLGGPLGHFLVKRQSKSDHFEPIEVSMQERDSTLSTITTSPRSIINALLFFAICVSLGQFLNIHLLAKGVLLPGFVTAMLVGVVLNYITGFTVWKIQQPSVNLIGQVTLNLFLAMSLMSINLFGLSEFIGKISLIMFAQIILVILFSLLIIYPLAGKNYDAAVISAGFTGIALGATPIGVANMQSMVSRYGPSQTAFIVIPLLGACILDLVNATVIQIWLSIGQ